MKFSLIISLISTLLIISGSAKQLKLTANDVIVIFNSDLESSRELANYYKEKRQIPEANVIGFPMPETLEISRETFSSIHDKINFHLLGLRDSPQHAFVLMKGVPLKIQNQKDPLSSDAKPKTAEQNNASFDSELAANINKFEIKSAVKNTYFEADLSIGDYKLLYRSAKTPRLVTRIDGPTVEDCKRLIDDSIETEKTGLWGATYLDKAFKGSNYGLVDDAIDHIERLNWDNGIPSIVEKTKHTFPTDYPMNDAAVYFGWYTSHASGPLDDKNFRFKKGAIATHVHSFSAARVDSTTKFWTGPLVSRGACAVFGNVYEPYLQGTSHLDIFYSRLLKGYTLAEAAYMATPVLSWQGIIIGDPLYTPYKYLASGKGEITEADKPYRALNTLWKLEMNKADDKVRKLRSVAAKSGNPKLYEFIGLWNEYQKDFKNAEMFYIATANLTENEAMILKMCLHRAYLHLNKNEKDKALKLLRDTKKQLPDAEHKRAVSTLILLHDPPRATEKK